MMIFFVLVAMLFPTFAFAQSQELQSLRPELQKLQREQTQLDTDMQSIKSELARLADVKQTLTDSNSRLQQDKIAYRAREAEVNNRARQFDSTCAGYQKDEAYSRCQSTREQLMQQQHTLESELRIINERQHGYNEQRLDTQKKTTLAEARRQKLLNYEQELDFRKIQLLDRIHRIQLDDSVLRDPRMREQRSRECRAAASLEDAHRCLQSVFGDASR